MSCVSQSIQADHSQCNAKYESLNKQFMEYKADREKEKANANTNAGTVTHTVPTVPVVNPSPVTVPVPVSGESEAQIRVRITAAVASAVDAAEEAAKNKYEVLVRETTIQLSDIESKLTASASMVTQLQQDNTQCEASIRELTATIATMVTYVICSVL